MKVIASTFLVLLSLTIVHSAPFDTPDRVTYLDGIGSLENGPKVYSGFVEVNQQYGANLFYLFVESQSNPSTDPVVLWLQGGPGCSSLFGLWVENGPWHIDSKGNMYNNTYSWNQKANLIYIDNPVGSGYSYVNNPLGYVTNEKTMAVELYTALIGFFKMHPEYSKNEFYVFGESYAGKYIPSLTHYILTQNQLNPPLEINLQGLAMGDGWVDPYIQTGSYAEFLYSRGLIGKIALDAAEDAYFAYKLLVDTDQYILADDAGNLILESVITAAGGVDVYDIRYIGGDPTDALGDLLSTYLNQASVMKQLHAGTGGWNQCDTIAFFGLIDDVEQSVANLLPDLLANYPVMNYNGNMDVICNMIGTSEWTAQINWPGQNEYNNAKNNSWVVDGEPAGYWKAGGNLTHLIVYNAGHMAPFSQPKNTLDLLYGFIAGQFSK